MRSRRTTLCINALKSPGHEHKGCKRVLKSCQVLGSNLPGMKGIYWHVCTVFVFKLYWVNSKANVVDAGSMTYTEKNSKNYFYFINDDDGNEVSKIQSVRRALYNKCKRMIFVE